jgi:hypothetical protein
VCSYAATIPKVAQAIVLFFFEQQESTEAKHFLPETTATLLPLAADIPIRNIH